MNKIQASCRVLDLTDEQITQLATRPLQLSAHLIGVAFHGKYKGQRQKWFAMRFTGKDTDIDLTAHEPEFSDFQWVSLGELPGLIVPFKRETYKAVIAAFKNLA